jgi:DNA-directed RNA polymerase specialized sigma24 family protein
VSTYAVLPMMKSAFWKFTTGCLSRWRLRSIPISSRDTSMHDTTLLEAYPLACLAAKVRSIASASATGSMILDREDVEQEAIVDLWRALPSFDPSRSSSRPIVELVIASRVTSVLRLQHVAKRKPAFCDAPAVMEYEPMEVRVDVERVLAALSDDRRLACLLVDHTPGLCCFVAGR